MKNQFGWKMVGGMAVAVALGTMASAQVTGSGSPRRGEIIPRGSLDNDIREGRGPRQADVPDFWGEISADATQALSFSVGVRPRPEHQSGAFVPQASDMDKVLRLEGGIAGRLALIEVGLLVDPWSEHPGFLGGAVLSGPFQMDGTFEVELPSSLDVRGLGAVGAQVPGKLITVMVDLEEAVEEAFAEWMLLGAIGGGLGAGTPGSGTLLPQPAAGAGFASQAPVPTVFVTVEAPGQEVIEAPGFDVLGRLADPQHGGVGAGGGTELRRPTRGHGHAGQVGMDQLRDRFDTIEAPSSASVESNEFDVIGSLPDPQNGASAGSGTTLRRPVRGGGHTGRR